jgi:hypothetical protein
VEQRFSLEKDIVGDNHLICTDKDNSVTCEFEQGKFSDTRRFALQYDIKQPDTYVYAKVCGEIEDWLKENHSEKL